MQNNQGEVHQNGRDHRLENADGDGLAAHVPELLQTELIADGEGDEAQGHLGNYVQRLHLCGGAEAQAEQLQRADAVGPQQQAGNQIGGYGGQVQLFGQTAQQQPAHQGQGQLDQDFHGDTSFAS